MFQGFIRRRFRALKRRTIRHKLASLIAVALFIGGLVSYANYMDNQRFSIDRASSKPLLDLIAKAESSGNYNAYFGNSTNTKIQFTKMSIADVMKWQKEYVASGSASSAVGRYQIIDTTLAGLVREMRLDPSQTFDEKLQDDMAITLLERRGAEQYVNDELSDKEFAANLAKEWAGLPKMTGDNPEDSYYAGDGLNKSRVKPGHVLGAIKPIEPK